MKEPGKPPTPDWRARLRTLPNGVEPDATPFWMALLQGVVFYGLLAGAGLVCSFFAGVLIGLEMGISPEAPAAYLVIGAAFTFLIAGIVAWVLKRRGHSQVGWIFYALALPAPAVILLGVALTA